MSLFCPLPHLRADAVSFVVPLLTLLGCLDQETIWPVFQTSAVRRARRSKTRQPRCARPTSRGLRREHGGCPYQKSDQKARGSFHQLSPWGEVGASDAARFCFKASIQHQLASRAHGLPTDRPTLSLFLIRSCSSSEATPGDLRDAPSSRRGKSSAEKDRPSLVGS